MSSRRLLLVDADPAVHDLFHSVLQRDDRALVDAYDAAGAIASLRSAACDLVLAGPGRNGTDGIKLLRRVRAVQPDAKVIVTGEPDRNRVVGAIRNRAYSYFHKPLPAVLLAETVQQALDAVHWRDDIRVISALPEWLTLEVRCKLDAAERTTHFLREIEADLAAAMREDICSAFRELLMNAIEHGGKSNPHKRVRVSLLRTSRSVIVHIHDPGTGFSLDFLPHAAISNPDDSPTKHVEFRAEQGVRPGGFGILMTRNLVDDLLYNERGNAVMFVKYL